MHKIGERIRDYSAIIIMQNNAETAYRSLAIWHLNPHPAKLRFELDLKPKDKRSKDSRSDEEQHL